MDYLSESMLGYTPIKLADIADREHVIHSHASVTRRQQIFGYSEERRFERGLLADYVAQVEALFNSSTLIVDACRYSVRGAGMTVPLATRPVLCAWRKRCLGAAARKVASTCRRA